MSKLYNKEDNIKQKLRELKKIEIKIWSNHSGLYKKNIDAFNPLEHKKLIWSTFFDLKGNSIKKVKYSMTNLLSMSKEELKEVINEYFYTVYSYYSKERGFECNIRLNEDLLTQLDLPIYAEDAEIKRKIRELAKKYHPDNGGDSSKFLELMERLGK